MSPNLVNKSTKRWLIDSRQKRRRVMKLPDRKLEIKSLKSRLLPKKERLKLRRLRKISRKVQQRMMTPRLLTKFPQKVKLQNQSRKRRLLQIRNQQQRG